MWTKRPGCICAGAIVLALTACGANNLMRSSSETVPVSGGASSSASGYGVIQSIEAIPREQSGGGVVGLGTAAGAVVGGVLGNQGGAGRGRTAATVAGAAGGR
jgi:outer membrane lipoprotein SlyB